MQKTEDIGQKTETDSRRLKPEYGKQAYRNLNHQEDGNEKYDGQILFSLPYLKKRPDQISEVQHSLHLSLHESSLVQLLHRSHRLTRIDPVTCFFFVSENSVAGPFCKTILSVTIHHSTQKTLSDTIVPSPNQSCLLMLIQHIAVALCHSPSRSIHLQRSQLYGTIH